MKSENKLFKVQTIIVPKRNIVGITGIVYAVLEHVITKEKKIFVTHNIVTNGGDRYYAQLGCGESPPYDYTAGGLKLGDSTAIVGKSDTDVTSYILGTYDSLEATYPKTSDLDVGNPGATGVDIITWKYSYPAGTTINGIDEGAIVDQEVSPNDCLTHWVFGTTINKSTLQILNVYVNHQFNGT